MWTERSKNGVPRDGGVATPDLSVEEPFPERLGGLDNS